MVLQIRRPGKSSCSSCQGHMGALWRTAGSTRAHSSVRLLLASDVLRPPHPPEHQAPGGRFPRLRTPQGSTGSSCGTKTRGEEGGDYHYQLHNKLTDFPNTGYEILSWMGPAVPVSCSHIRGGRGARGEGRDIYSISQHTNYHPIVCPYRLHILPYF